MANVPPTVNTVSVKRMNLRAAVTWVQAVSAVLLITITAIEENYTPLKTFLPSKTQETLAAIFAIAKVIEAMSHGKDAKQVKANQA